VDDRITIQIRNGHLADATAQLARITSGAASRMELPAEQF
jgi:hypothetical protein